jgi:hypothetical protein
MIEQSTVKLYESTSLACATKFPSNVKLKRPYELAGRAVGARIPISEAQASQEHFVL